MPEIGPLRIDEGQNELVLRFVNARQPYLAVPPNLETDLTGYVADSPERIRGRKLVFDLEDIVGLTSRHLGILVTAQKVLRPLGGLHLRGVSSDMKRQLEVTRILSLFPDLAS